MQRRTFPTTIELVDGSTWKTLDGQTAFKVGNAERRVPTEAELDQMLFDLVIDTLRGKNPDPDPPPPTIATDAELRRQAKALGLPVPPPRQGTAEWFRDDMLNLLNGPSR